MKTDALLNTEEMAALGRLLRFVLREKPVFTRGLQHTLTGRSLEEAQDAISGWPEVDLTDDETDRAVIGTLAALGNFPHKQWPEIEESTGFSQADVVALWRRLRAVNDD